MEANVSMRRGVSGSASDGKPYSAYLIGQCFVAYDMGEYVCGNGGNSKWELNDERHQR